MYPHQQPRRRPHRRRQLLLAGATVGLVLLAIAVVIGYRYDITLWEWSKLLIVPAVIAGGGIWFNAQQKKREQQITDQRAQDEALQAYLHQMGELLLDKETSLRKSEEGAEVRTLARARTRTLLAQLDGGNKASVMQFLHESGLIDKDSPIVNLKEADLSKAELSSASLYSADLSWADLTWANLSAANLSEANLSEAKLGGADLSWAHLEGANLYGADLVGADLSEARLRGAYLRMAHLRDANLSGAFLIEANLYRAKLYSTDLRGADLSGADLSKAELKGVNLSEARGVTVKQLAAALELIGVTMPNGQKYEDWLKD